MADDRHIDPRFLPLLTDFDSDALEDNSATIYGLWPDLTLAYFNRGWTRFAALNAGEPQVTSQWPIGRCILDAIALPLCPFFAANYSQLLREQRPGSTSTTAHPPESTASFI